jgi:2-polyprenyl-6-methoxyphenol hydroxylase-like FAD-dependent oxidoreductase
MNGADLHAILLKRVPGIKIRYGKRILSTMQDENNGVLIRTSDGNSYSGELLIGCDGTYSAVRQSLYKNLSKVGQLPRSDTEDLKVCHMLYVGMTNPMDPAMIPDLVNNDFYGCVVIGNDKPQTVGFVLFCFFIL